MKYAPRFSATCPHCECEADQGTFRTHALRQFLDEDTFRLYCPRCDVEWQPDRRELQRVEALLSHPVANRVEL